MEFFPNRSKGATNEAVFFGNEELNKKEAPGM